MNKVLNLSKSKYCSAIQCNKILWLKKNKSDEYDDSVLNEAILTQGNKVGDLAMGLFGSFVEVPFDNKLSNMITKTQELLDLNTPVIAEASFIYDNCYCAVDILKKVEDGYEIYEVKSSTQVSDIYKDDCAYQYYVLKNLGLNIKKVSLVHINNEYVRKGELELDKLFKIVDLTPTSKEKENEVRRKIEELNEYMSSVNEPYCDICPHCFDPYNCGFFKYCSKHLPENNFLSIRRFSKKWDFYERGIISF